jgi:hypothetical protein
MIYFVTETQIKNITGISDNVDAKNVMPFMQPAADLFMSIILGREYYDYLLDAYNAQTLNAAEIVLVEHIIPATSWRAASIAIDFNWAKWTNKGPQTQSGEFSAGLDTDGLSFIKQNYINMSEYYENRVVRFLKLNKDDYPGYTAESNKTDTPPSTTDNFDLGGMMFV